MLDQIKKVARYCVVGSVALLVDYASYFFFTRSLHLAPYAANILAYCCGNVFSFVGHRFITFHAGGSPKIFSQYLRFLVVTVIGLTVSEFVILLTIDRGIPDIYGKAAAVLLSGVCNFYLNSVWTFKVSAKTPVK